MGEYLYARDVPNHFAGGGVAYEYPSTTSDVQPYTYSVSKPKRGRSRGNSVRNAFRGVSTPLGHKGAAIYGEAIMSLSRRTQQNLKELQQKLIQHDPCYEYGMEHWHTSDAIKGLPQPHVYPEYATPTWESKDTVFTLRNNLNHMDLPPREDETPKSQPAEGDPNFCYLCSTLEEHQQHLAKRGLQLKPKPKRKLRIEYLAPSPTVRVKQEEEEIVEPKPEVLYKVLVTTGNKPSAGTSANVYITLYGRKNVLRKRQLKKNTCLQHNFGRGGKDTFYLKSPDLGELQGMVIEHDGEEWKHSWLLQEVEVTEMTSQATWLFVVKNWLSLFTPDRTLKRKVRAERVEKEEREYDIRIVTGQLPLGGTDSRVFITLYGKKGVSAREKLTPEVGKFERGSTNDFPIITPDIGRITKIKIEHDNTGKRSPDWLVEKVTIISDEGEKYVFPCGEWLSESEGDGSLFRYLMPMTKKVEELMEKKEKEKVDFNEVQYELSVVTGNIRYAGTDANVYIIMIGTLGKSHEIQLDDGKNNFEKGDTDVFKVCTANIGYIKKITVRHDNSGVGAGWFLETVSIRRFLPKAEIRERLAEMDAEAQEDAVEHVAELTGKKIQGSAVRRQSLQLQKSYRGSDTDDEDKYGRKGKEKKKKKYDKYGREISDSDSDDGGRKVKKDKYGRPVYDSDDDKKKKVKRDKYGRKIDDSDSDDAKKKSKKKDKYGRPIYDSDSDDDGKKKSRRKDKYGRPVDSDSDKDERKKKKKRDKYGRPISESDSDDKKKRVKKVKFGRPIPDSDSDDERKKKKKRDKYGRIMSDSDSDNDKRKKKKDKYGRVVDDSDDDKKRKVKRDKYGRPLSDSDDDKWKGRKGKDAKGKDKKKRVFSYGGIETLVTDSEDSDDDRSGRGKGKRRVTRLDDSDEDKPKRRDKSKLKVRFGITSSSESESEQSDDDYGTRKQKKEKENRRRSKRGASAKSEDSGSEEDKMQVGKLFTAWRKGRVPYCDEFLFVCKRWLANDEDDGQIERHLKPKSVTTFYRTGNEK